MHVLSGAVTVTDVGAGSNHEPLLERHQRRGYGTTRRDE